MVDAPKIPQVNILKVIEPSAETARAEQFTYNELGAIAFKHAGFETPRQREFFDAAPESLTEIKKAKQIANQYLLMTADKLNRAVTPASKDLWSQRYTQAASELFGVPETKVAQQLGQDMVGQIIGSAQESDTLHRFYNLADAYGLVSHNQEIASPQFEKEAAAMSDVLERRYSHVYEAMELANTQGYLTAAEVADKFETGIAKLAEADSPDWQQVKVVRDQDTSRLRVAKVQDHVQLRVGLLRAAAPPEQVKGSFTHEALIHIGQRLNGNKQSAELGSGLPDSLDTQEGLGVFAEYAVTGKIPPKNIDRYVDVALALGLIDGKPKTRQELVRFAGLREELRSEIVDDKRAEDEITKSVYTHVNRIYRGSLGNEYIGVFTKDIAYQNGFMTIGNFIAKKLAGGETPDSIFDYLMQGKFDPTNPKHVAYVDDLQKSNNKVVNN